MKSSTEEEYFMIINLTTKMAIQNWNENISLALLPNTILTVFFLITGVIGNVTTIVVYILWMKIPNERFLIPVLAVIDLMAALCNSSFTIIQQQMQVNFSNKILCKAIWLVGGFFTFLSINVLTLISVQRYIKMCHPFKIRINRYQLRVWLFLAILFAVSLSIPTVIFYGLVETSSTSLNITGLRCSRLETTDKSYEMCIAVFIIATVLLLIFFYSKIAFKLNTHYRNIASFSKEWNSMNNCDNMGLKRFLTLRRSKTMQKTKIEENNTKPTPKRVMYDEHFGVKYKLTYMFMVITSIFIICFVSKLAILILKSLNKSLDENMSDESRNGLMFGSQFFILHNAINPYVYAFMDTKFQARLKHLFKSVTREL